MHILTWRPKEYYRCESIENHNFEGCIILDKTNSEDRDLDLGSREVSARARTHAHTHAHARTHTHEYVCIVRTYVRIHRRVQEELNIFIEGESRLLQRKGVNPLEGNRQLQAPTHLYLTSAGSGVEHGCNPRTGRV
jgi:hypothetical protein